MKRLLLFDSEGLYVGEEIVSSTTVPTESQYLADLDEVISFYSPKLVDGAVVEGLSTEEIEAITAVSLAPSAAQALEMQVLSNKFDIMLLQMGI